MVLGALASITKNFKKYINKIWIKIKLRTAQKNVLSWIARKLGKVLEIINGERIDKEPLVIGYNQLPC